MTDPRFASPVPPYGGQPQDRLPGDAPVFEGVVLDAGQRPRPGTAYDGGSHGGGGGLGSPYGGGFGPYGRPVGAVRPLRQKSLLLAALLAGLFPPLGMLYATLFGTLVMSFIALPVMLFSAGHAAPALWPLCVLWAVWAAHRKNQRRLAWAAMGF